MHPNIKPYQDRVEAGHLRNVVSPCGRLVLFGYTDKCTFERAWDEYTMQARGLIFEIATGKVVARPFKKFFNFGENGTSLPENPDEVYYLLEKMDGSLGIIYHYDGKWNIATRGSFTSDQANYAREHLLPRYDLSKVNKTLTLLTEIIYPENKIVVPYGDRRELVLLGCNCLVTGPYLTLEMLSEESGIALAPFHRISIAEALEKREILPRTEEGWVLWYPFLDLRIKIKGAEYLKIAKILANMSPLSLWEVMVDGKVPEEYLAQLPEEFRVDVDAIVSKLETEYLRILEMAHDQLSVLPSRTDYRAIGIFLKENPEIVNYPALVFPLVKQNQSSLTKIIMGLIRPKGNKLKGEE